ncbi:hypothetical protein BC629DRAFT_1590815 [Irpex lacteus]|nr:hypothetical protein BC629DRAFT_1590815 [Irpex lacteus]
MSGTDVALVVLFIVPFIAGYGVYKGGKALIWDLPRKHLRRSKPKQSPYAPKPEYTRSETYIPAPYEQRAETVRQRPRDVEGAPAGETLQPEFSRAKPFSRRPSLGSL